MLFVDFGPGSAVLWDVFFGSAGAKVARDELAPDFGVFADELGGILLEFFLGRGGVSGGFMQEEGGGGGGGEVTSCMGEVILKRIGRTRS